MYLARQRLIKKQILINKQNIQLEQLQKKKQNEKVQINKQYKQNTNKYMIISKESLDALQSLAHLQLSMNKVISRQIDYHRIQMFLLFTNQPRKKQFYKKLSSSLRQIFNNEKTQKVFDQKWTHSLKNNVMNLFNRIVIDYYHPNSTIRQHFNDLYFETIEKLMKDEKLSRVEQKFIDSFLSETMRKSQNNGIQILGINNKNQIYQISLNLQKTMNTRETPKNLSSSQYLQYSIFSLLGLNLPHQKYLYNQLLHAPNPKYLYPFRKKGTFTALTNEILLKSNKIDMISLKYWSYYEYQQSQIYQKVRKASEWQQKIKPLAIMLKKKVNHGLQKYMNLIDQKIRYYNNREFDDDGINLLNSYVQLCLQICYNHVQQSRIYSLNKTQQQNIVRKTSIQYNFSKVYQSNQDFQPHEQKSYQSRTFNNDSKQNLNSQLFLRNSFNIQKYQDLSTVLQRVDIGTAFQSDHISLKKQSKLKYFTIKLTELYFILITNCRKSHLRLKFIPSFTSSMEKIITNQTQRKFTQQIITLSLKYLKLFTYQQKQLFIYSTLERINQQWYNEQVMTVNNQISKINKQVLQFLSSIIEKYGFDDNNDPAKKILKLQFFYILALNFNENGYFESKKRLSKSRITINVNLSNNSIFDTLQIRKVTQEKFKSHLKQLFGDYSLEKKQHEGIIAIIDEILTYRIQVSKQIPDTNKAIDKSYYQHDSFYSVLINFLQEAQRLDPTKKLLHVVKNYCQKCKKTYFIEVNQMKFKDETKKRARQLFTQDISYLVQASISSNPIIADFSQQILFEYIEQISQLAFYTRILIVFAECITILYKKASVQYESKAQTLKGKNLTSSILIPTDNKVIINRLTKIMIALYKIILKGHCIDDNYMRVKIGYLIKQFSTSAKTPFGWKYLKYLINNFKQDKQFIAKQILTNNSCSWFINQSYFSRKIKQMKPKKLLLDKYLLPLHEGECFPAQLKKLLTNIDVQEQTQFLIIPAAGSQQSFSSIIRDLQKNCQIIQRIQISSGVEYAGFTTVNSPKLNHYDNVQTIINAKTQRLQQLQQYQNSLYNIISRIKMTYINKTSQIDIFSSIFQICKKYNNSELLKYILIKIVPFVYCINQYNERLLILISEMLYYVVNQLNKATKLVYNQSKVINNGQTQVESYNTFDLFLDCFGGLEQYQLKEHSGNYEKLYKKSFNLQKNGNNSNDEQKSFKFMVIKFYSLRLFNLKKMFKQLQKFLSQNMHVCIGKGFSLTLIVQIFSINFLLDSQVLQFLHLQSICYCLTSQLQLVNVLKASLEKGQNSFEERSLVQDFERQTLKMGLHHFERRHNYYKEQLLNQTHNIKSLKTKIDFLIQICDYLRNEDFHEIKKKKLPKRTDKVFKKNKKEHKLFSQITDQGQKKSIFLRGHLQRTSIVSQHGQNIEKQIRRITRSNQNLNDGQIYDPGSLRFILLYLISQQVDKTKAYSFSQLSEIQNPYSLANKKKFISSQMILSTYSQMGYSNVLIFNLLKIFGNRIDNPQIIQHKLVDKITQKPDHGFPQFLQIFIENNKNTPNKIKQINFWKAPNVQILFKYLSKDYQDYPYLQQYVTKILSRLHSDQILFYLPQIFQTLTLKTGQIIYNFLLQYARSSASFAHQLIWIAKVQSKQQKDPHNKNPRLPGVDENLKKLQKISKRLIKDVLSQFTKQEKVFFRQVNDFYEQVTAISGKMKPAQPKDVKKEVIRLQVDKIIIPQSAYLPINPIYKVVDIDRDSGIPMQSAAKCPFLLTFICQKYQGPDKDFENRKKYKKYLQTTQIDNQFEQIKEQRYPLKIPTLKSILHGGRSPKIDKFYQSEDDFSKPYASNVFNNDLRRSETKSKFQQQLNNMSQQISEGQIRMDFSQKNSRKDNYESKKTKQFNLQKSKTYSNKELKNQTTQISLIFKVFDDIRQDCLALQVIRLFTQIFQRHNLQLKLFSYKTISNRTGKQLDIGGIIQVVPKTVSRDSIGKTNQQSLYEFFISNFGPEYNIRFQEARQNFIKSQAAYSIISYILQIKDRHNGNILINTEEGYLIHIDFGFIFDISPANNLKFEKADFKLTQQMIKIMGGSIQSQPFQLYLNLVIKGFLISRRYSQHIINVIKQMYNSGLPCFLPKSIENLRSRFVLEKGQIQAAEYMKQIVYKAADNWFTNWYDKIQWIQQKIYH